LDIEAAEGFLMTFLLNYHIIDVME